MQTEQSEKQQQTEEQEQQGRTPPDPELNAMKRIRTILADLPPSARGRVLAYVVDRAQEERTAPMAILRGATLSEYEQQRLVERGMANFEVPR